MYTRICLILDNIVSKPCGSGLGEANVRHVNGEVFTSANSDVANSSEVHDRFVGLFLDNDGITWSAWVAVTDVVHCDHSEEVLLAFGEFRYRVHVGRYQSAINVVPFVLTSLLHLDDVASDLSTTVATWWSPTQRYRIFRYPVRFRWLGSIRTH